MLARERQNTIVEIVNREGSVRVKNLSKKIWSNWNNYFIPALVLDTADKKTLPILIAQLRSADFLKFDMGKVYMMVAIAILPVIIVYLLLSKFIVRGVALGGVKG